VYDNGKRAAGEMAWIVPFVEFDFLRFTRVLTMRPRWIRIACVRAHQPVDHQF
jgi:hypothetical protein